MAVGINILEPMVENIVLVIFPFRNPSDGPGKVITIYSSNLADVLAALAKELSVITSNFRMDFLHNYKGNIKIINVKAPIVRTTRESIVSKFLRFLLAQFTITIELLKLPKSYKRIFVFLGSSSMLFPLLLLRLQGQKTISVTTGTVSHSWQSLMSPFYLGRLYSAILKKLDLLGYSIVDKVVVYSDILGAENTLKRYHHKIAIAHKHFIDFAKFNVLTPLDERVNLVGYIGRLSREKGVLNFVGAIPWVLERSDKVRFMIGGDGDLMDEVESYLSQANLNNTVDVLGWVSHDDLPARLNELKLLVLPSYTEGLPNIMLEAMACGTPVLATPVGAIPDIIKDGITGFIMENNSPECVAENIVRVLNYSDLKGIAQNAHNLVESEFSFENAVDQYRNAIQSIS